MSPDRGQSYVAEITVFVLVALTMAVPAVLTCAAVRFTRAALRGREAFEDGNGSDPGPA